MIPNNAADEKKRKDEENQLDRRMITPEMKSAIKQEIANIDDPDTKKALKNIYHILTGEEV